MAPWELRKCMELPRIETIYVRELSDLSPGHFTSFKVPTSKHRTSPLAELRIGSPNFMAYQSLKMLLQIPEALKHMAIECCALHSPIFGPSDLLSLLEPVRDTLEELHMDIRNGMLGQDNGPFDLSAFQSLRKLTLPFRFIFRRGAEISHRVDTLLPPYLTDLKMAFSPAPQDPREAIFRPPSTTSCVIAGWLATIDERKEGPLRMPALTNVTMQENDKMSQFSDLHIEPIQEMFEQWKTDDYGGSESRLHLEYCL